MPDAFSYTRLQDGNKLRIATLKEAIGVAAEVRETWLFVSPHDDDLVIGAGLWMQAAVRAGVDVQVLVVTDGRMGYCTLDQRDTISDVRRRETYESFEILGVGPKQIAWFGYPDAGLYTLQGRRRQRADDEAPAIEGFVGLSNAFTYHLRRTRAARVFVPTAADLHPDHQIVNNELMISLFHAAGAIWPELGAPLADVPKVYELAIYCDFPQPPQLQLRASTEVFEKKLQGILAYRSQLQIARLVEITRTAGPLEYLRELNFRFYSPASHAARFA
ncbi:MAG TPA: PIG-L family deacetylase [Tepidisphaeraceae bacterium]|nr:PIG-L family deacetylase [Tepidisphaeraceae bacterium]